MNKNIRIAIIDNGIDDRFLNRELENRITVDKNGICINDQADMRQQRFRHGTYCAMIIEKHLKNCKLTSIRILDGNGNGEISNLRSALEWCYCNGIRLVNLSMGTTHFVDKKLIRSVINEYANKGIVIVAASANSGYMSYPASFTNVIGVVAGDCFKFGNVLKWQKGIDFESPCECWLESCFGKLQIAKSNSYATPYSTALVGKLMFENHICHANDVKRKLLKLCGNDNAEDYICPVPDWITAAWLDGTLDYSEEKPYCSIYTGKYEQYEKIVDTIVFTASDKLKQYRDLGKHLIYLGKEQLDVENFDGFYWSRQNRIRQIRNVEKRAENLEIPCIICIADNETDLFLLLLGLKERFAIDGHNIYAVSLETQSVLYDLEYIPHEFFYEEWEKLQDFLYWQTYYQQSDGILYAVHDAEASELDNVAEKMDMVIWIKYMSKGIHVEICCDGKLRENFRTSQFNYDILYEKILHLLTEEQYE